jgi:hypothetical protein
MSRSKRLLVTRICYLTMLSVSRICSVDEGLLTNVKHSGWESVEETEVLGEKLPSTTFFFSATARILALAYLHETLRFTSVYYILDSR